MSLLSDDVRPIVIGTASDIDRLLAMRAERRRLVIAIRRVVEKGNHITDDCDEPLCAAAWTALCDAIAPYDTIPDDEL